ncbi:MAG: ribonuclease PH [Planctomycetaceae bacterium]|nr:ribonuclease PH [Planctomycetaceae bacterium]
MTSRPDQRHNGDLRPIRIQRPFPTAAPGSLVISAGETVVLCTASIVEQLPTWKQNDTSGWLTAEYRMLPASTSPRSNRSDRPDGRATEIQRLVGRSLRAVVDLEAIGPRTVYIDCDVLKADGGTRTLGITGAFIALVEALHVSRELLAHPEKLPLRDSVAAVSVGMVEGQPRLDLCYVEDIAAEVDMNVVMTGSGRFVELQGTGEEATFSEHELHDMLRLAKLGIARLTDLQKETLGELWPL